MSERENNSILVRAARGSVRRFVRNMLHRSILALAALVALVFVPAGPSRAQSQSAASKPTVTGVGASTSNQVAPANTATIAQAARLQPAVESTDSTGQSAPQGRHEGITVHGHWTIEVRNPDGTLASRRAFDNELINSGSTLLGNLLAGTVAPGGWELILAGTNPTQVPASQPNPCGTGAFGLGGGAVTFIPNPGFNACGLFEAGTSVGVRICGGGSPAVFCTLTRTPAIGQTVGANSGQVAITLSGTFPAPNPGWVGSVASNLDTCNGGATTGTGLATVSASDCMTGLPGAVSVNFLTATLLPTPVQVTVAGQIVAVTLTLSFQ